MDDETIINETRKIILSHFKGLDYIPKVNGRAGVFVTLKKDGKLRGCIGIVHPSELGKNLKEAAIGVLHDPRFFPVTKEEFKKIKLEVSLLTEPKKVSNPLKEIIIGKDGLIIQKRGHSGLLLPQVATEFKMTLNEFLRATAKKAGLSEDEWESAEIFKFQAKVISETI